MAIVIVFEKSLIPSIRRTRIVFSILYIITQ